MEKVVTINQLYLANKVVNSALEEKLDKNLGVDNANKILSIDAEGNIIPIDNTTGGGGGGDFEQVQADWEENDATSNAYIKNRPFYVNNYNLPFQRLTFEPSTYNSNVYKTSLIGLVAADGVEGQEYVVEWDGVEYVTTCKKVTFDLVNNDVIGSIELKRTIGNPALWNSEGVIESQEQDSGEPFFLQLDTTLNAVGNSAVGMDLDCVITKDTSPIHTIRVFGTDNVVQLDEKFIPDSVKLPTVTEDDNGKTIGVVDGEWSVVDIPEGGNGGPVHWNDVTGKPFIKENKHIFVDHSKVDTSIAFTSTELRATFIRLTEETLSKDELVGATLTGTLASGDKIPGVVSESDIHFEDNNCLILTIEGLEGLEGLPIAVFYKAGQHTVNIYGFETTVQVPKAGIYTTDYVVTNLASSEITTNVTREYLDNKCLSILEIRNKPTEFLHEIEFTNQWNDLFRVFAYLNPIDEETFNAWNANTEPVIVNYDDVEYICMPQALSFNGESGISVGNLASFEGGTGNNEPFAITCGYDTAAGLYFAIIGSTVDREPTGHSVAIYLQDETYKIKDEYLEDFIKEISEEIVSVANGKPGMKTEGVDFVDASGGIHVCMDGEVFNSYANGLQLDANNRPVSGNIAAGLYSHAEGDKTFAWGELAHTEGYLTYVGSTGIYGHAEGCNTVVNNLCGHAEGNNTKAEGAISHAEGANTKATGMASHAEGASTKTSANYAHAEGNTTVASGEGAHAEGGYTNLLHNGSGGEITSQSTTASGKYSHAEGKGSVASGEASHAEGWGSIASGKYSHAEGGGTSFDDGETLLVMSKSTGTIASGDFSHAEGKGSKAAGMASHAEGMGCTANGDGSHAEGYSTEARGLYSHSDGYQTLALGDYSHAGGYKTYAEDYQYVVGRNNSRNTTCPESADTHDNTNSDAIFIIGYGTESSQGANAFRVSSGGKCFGTTAFGTSGADFAELFEWADGNPNNEDRRGLFVALDGERIRLANAGDDYIGVISGSHAFLGNSASEEWHDKYLTDVFGARLTQEVEVSAEINEITGEVIRPATITTQYVLNPDYNPNTPYVMRENRKEWGIVGLLGQVVMIDDGTCVAGGYIAPSKNGIGTISDKGYRVMKRIDANHVKILIK